MSTATIATPTSTAYDHDARSRAAKLGWVFRRAVPSPEQAARIAARQRFDAAVKAADWRLARLYACAEAEAVQQLFLAQHPGDMRTLEAITVARAYANGERTDKERLSASRLLRPLYEAVDTSRPINDPADCALESACFTLWKQQAQCIDWTLAWADHARTGKAYDRPDYARHTAALEALARG